MEQIGNRYYVFIFPFSWKLGVLNRRHRYWLNKDDSFVGKSDEYSGFILNSFGMWMCPGISSIRSFDFYIVGH